MRADQLLVERGLAASRSQAQRLIGAGVQWRAGLRASWRRVAKNGDELPDQAELQLCDAAEARYVSRGGLKLEGALVVSGLDVHGRRCLDVGQSTGGFTDCLLAHGASQVIGVDVGHGQLNERLRADPRVICIEQVNARERERFDAVLSGVPGVDLAVADLSFISLTLVLPAIAPHVRPGGDLLLLVKPQFELQPGQIGKGGVVRDATLYPAVEQRLRAACAVVGLQVLAWFDSPITGRDGNCEFFLHARQPAA